MVMAAESGGVVYLLRDPRDRSPRYVGATARALSQRMAEHIRDARHHRRGGACHDWLRGLLDAGLRPEVEVLEHVGAGLQDAERAWIVALRASCSTLLNEADGGRGGATARGKPLSPEHRAKIAAANRKDANPERAARIAEHRRRQWQDPEYRERMLAAGRKGSEAAAAKKRGT